MQEILGGEDCAGVGGSGTTIDAFTPNGLALAFTPHLHTVVCQVVTAGIRSGPLPVSFDAPFVHDAFDHSLAHLVVFLECCTELIHGG